LAAVAVRGPPPNSTLKIPEENILGAQKVRSSSDLKKDWNSGTGILVSRYMANMRTNISVKVSYTWRVEFCMEIED
jgi:hypothetical protein